MNQQTLAELMRDKANTFKSDALERNQKLIDERVKSLLSEITQAAERGESSIKYADLLHGDDKNVVTACNMEICRRLELDGFTISKNWNYKDFCWEQRSVVTISWAGSEVSHG